MIERHSPFRILIMDDHRPTREVAAQMLKFMGYRVTTCKDGVEALRAFVEARADGDGYDAVLTDLNVPGGMGGDGLIAGLMEVDPSVKAIVSTADYDAAVALNYDRYGFAGFLPKPFTMRDLREAVHKVLAH